MRVSQRLMRPAALAMLTLPVVSISYALASPSSRDGAVNALIVGEVLDCSGPARGHCSLQHRAVVSTYNSAHRLVAKETLTNGHFAFAVRPGRFMLVSPKCFTFAAPVNCHGHRAVTAQANKTVHANIVVRIR
jgi:hypothetical protein